MMVESWVRRRIVLKMEGQGKAKGSDAARCSKPRRNEERTERKMIDTYRLRREPFFQSETSRSPSSTSSQQPSGPWHHRSQTGPEQTVNWSRSDDPHVERTAVVMLWVSKGR